MRRWRFGERGFVSPLTKRIGSGLVALRIDMAEVALGRHLVAHELLQLLHLGETAMVLARPDQLAVELDLEHAARVVGDEGDGAELGGESRKQLLRRPAGPEQPIAEPAIGDLDLGPGHRGTGSSHLAWPKPPKNKGLGLRPIKVDLTRKA